jgi:precorrin-4/cobalt-precorrin-4 C11-methyltransferase
LWSPIRLRSYREVAAHDRRGPVAALRGDCPVAIVVNACWPDERIVRGTLGDICAKVATDPIERTALIFVGHGLAPEEFRESALYDAGYQRRFRGRSG